MLKIFNGALLLHLDHANQALINQSTAPWLTNALFMLSLDATDMLNESWHCARFVWGAVSLQGARMVNLSD